MRRGTWILAAPAAAVLLTGCAPMIETGSFSVIDDGSGPKLCTIILESYPPQCGDPVDVIDWDWAEWDHEESGSVRWIDGEFVVTHVGDAVRVEAAD